MLAGFDPDRNRSFQLQVSNNFATVPKSVWLWRELQSFKIAWAPAPHLCFQDYLLIRFDTSRCALCTTNA